MRSLLKSARARMVAGTAAGAVAASALFAAGPFTGSAQAQTAPLGAVAPGSTQNVGGVQVTNQSNQPANVQLTGNSLTIAGPAGFAVSVQGAQCNPVSGAGGQAQANVVQCNVTQGANITFNVQGVQRQPTVAVPPTRGSSIGVSY